jgi:outer membrane lipoprotein-sorting protein
MLRTFRLIAVAVVAVFALSMPAFAGQAKPAAKPAAKAAKAMTVSGTLQKVEGQDLTIQTTKGTEDVMLAPDAKIRRSGKTLTTSDLSGASGSRVTVRYKEDNGHKMAESVTLAPAKAAPKQVASAKPAAAAKGTKK